MNGYWTRFCFYTCLLLFSTNAFAEYYQGYYGDNYHTYYIYSSSKKKSVKKISQKNVQNKIVMKKPTSKKSKLQIYEPPRPRPIQQFVYAPTPIPRAAPPSPCYNPDMATGDDNTCRYVEMNIDR